MIPGLLLIGQREPASTSRPSIQIVPTMHFEIRKAIAADCPKMMELIHELAVFERAAGEVIVSFDHFVESGFGPNPVWWAFVAVGGESPDPATHTVVGFALYYIRYSTWKGQRMYLEDILVTQSARGNGIGTKLMDALFEEARARKFSGIVWQVLDWNQPAIDFYQRLGAKLDGEWINCTVTL